MMDDDDRIFTLPRKPATLLEELDASVEAMAQAFEAEQMAEIKRLASLSKVRYEAERLGAAARLDMRLGTLDELVKNEQQRHPPDEPQLDRIPWAAAVDGDKLVTELIGDLTRYVSLESDYAAVVAFWTIHTYLLDHIYITPRLAVTAPQPRCGKTTLMSWLETVVQRPIGGVVNISAAGVFHIVEERKPTLLIDEADTFLAKNDELRGILNSGHQKNGVVLRWDPKAKCSIEYKTFSACAISLIGTLPATLQDRSVCVRLQRRRPDEKIASLRGDRISDELARRCARWALDNQHLYAYADPAMPEQLFNRVEDNWRPLIAIADVIGGEWPTRFREIAVRIAALEAGEDPSADTQLLRDIQDIFGDRPWITTDELLGRLHLREYIMSSKRLANRLKPYSIKPKQERRGDVERGHRGYLAKDFADVFARYLGVPDVPDVTVAEIPPQEQIESIVYIPNPAEPSVTSGTSGTAPGRVIGIRRRI
jgi:hypothetical protein